MGAFFSSQCLAESTKVHTYTCFLDLPDYGSQLDYMKASGKTKQEAIMNVVEQCELLVQADDRSTCSTHAFNDAGESLHCRRSFTLTL